MPALRISFKLVRPRKKVLLFRVWGNFHSDAQGGQRSKQKMIDIYVLDGTRVRTNGSLIAIAEDPEIENVFQLNPGKVRIRHYSFRKESKSKSSQRSKV